MPDAQAVSRVEDKGSETCRWNLTAAKPNGEWWKSCGKSDKTFHVFGNLDGGTVRFLGSNDERCIIAAGSEASVKIRNEDGAIYGIISVSDNKNMGLLIPNPVYIRPIIESAGANADVHVVMTANTIL